MMLSMGLDGLPDGFGLGSLVTVLAVLAAMSLVRRPSVQPRLARIRSRQRDGTGPHPRS